MLTDHFQLLEFNAKLKSWYLLNHRPLPWRQTVDPYRIWLSEIILQQTRVAQGTPYYHKFIENFPTVADLAAADERDVLRLWQGLGYYSRARNMHFTARYIVSELSGNFPEKAQDLAKLKGLGNYTAAAIASFAFGEVVPAVDGNVYRVMSRLFGIFTDILSTEGKHEFLTLAKQLISRDDPATYNQAMIEFGAIQCIPVAPDCAVCPFNDLCYAFRFNMQSQLPVKAKKAAVRNRYFNYIILQQGDSLAMHERTGKDIWKGLYDFYLIESLQSVDSLDDISDDGPLGDWMALGITREISTIYLHLLTHQRLNVRFWWIRMPETKTAVLPHDMAFYSRQEIETLPKPILLANVLKEENFV